MEDLMGREIAIELPSLALPGFRRLSHVKPDQGCRKESQELTTCSAGLQCWFHGRNVKRLLGRLSTTWLHDGHTVRKMKRGRSISKAEGAPTRSQNQDQEIGACRHPAKPKLDWIIFDFFSRTSPKISQPTSTQRPKQRLTPFRSTRTPHTPERRHRVPPPTVSSKPANARCAFANPQPQSWVRLPAESPMPCARLQYRAWMLADNTIGPGNMANGMCSTEKEAREDGSGRFLDQPMYAYHNCQSLNGSKSRTRRCSVYRYADNSIQLSDHGPTKWTRSRCLRPRPTPTACAIVAATANVAASASPHGSLHALEQALVWEEVHRLAWEETASVGTPWSHDGYVADIRA